MTPGRSPLTLEAWIAAHGPLPEPAALALVLRICAQAARLSPSALAGSLGSLTAVGIKRRPTGGWSWVPESGSRTQIANDAEVLERIGALLFHCLSGQPPPDAYASASAVAAQLRRLRPGISPGVADLTSRAVTARTSGSGQSLTAFANDATSLLGLRSESGDRERQRTQRSTLVFAGVLAAIIVSAAWNPGRIGEATRGATLSPHEQVASDVLFEEAQVLALMEEHTAALGLFQDLARLWRSRFSPDDARLAWNEVQAAWVRTLAGDRLTAEQWLENKPRLLSAQLGEHHPYTRAVRLALADVLEARGAATDAAPHRMAAERAAIAVFSDAGITPELHPGTPAAPGVLAHVAPNAPEREGFRRAADGRFFVPMTSVQRLMAGRAGWRLQLVAREACETSLVVGNDLRLVVLRAARSPTGWSVAIEGTLPSLELNLPPSHALGVSLVADGTGSLSATAGSQPAHRVRIDSAVAAAEPPYSLTFAGRPDGAGCDVVWLEIPFPLTAKDAASINRP